MQAAREGQVFEEWREELNWEEWLLEQIANSVNLESAMQRVIVNKGAAGVDGMRVAQLKQGANTRLRAMRELGIPTVTDCVIRQSML